jgi:hypothetical protein
MAKAIDLTQVEHLASRGLTLEQIALSLGIAVSTLYKRKKEELEVSEAIKRGQASGIKEVSNALFENATGGNTVAQIFYLKNRAPDDWRDVKATEHSGSVEHKHSQELSRDELFNIASTGSTRDTRQGSGSGKPKELH